MEKIYNVCNTIENGSRKDRVKSRITPMKPFLTMLVLLMVALFGVNESAWADKTNQGTITILSGKGTVEIDAYYKYFGKYYHETNSTSTLNSAMTVSKTKHNTDDGWVKFTATADPGYTFYGWCEKSNCSDATPDLTNPKEWSAGSWTNLDVVRYTKFTPNSYDVTLALNGGSGSNQTVSATFDSGMPGTLKGGGAIVAPTKTGYTFAGYFDNTSGGTKYYNANLSSAHNWDKASTGVTLYAQWSPNNYTITLTAGAGTTSTGTTSLTATFDANTNLTSAITTPTKSGNVFDGYYTGANGTGAQIIDAFGNVIAQAGGDNTYTDADKKWKYANNIELFANWIAKYDFEITGSNYTINNDSWNQATAFNFVHADEANMTTTIEKTDVISYNRGTNTITALKIGTSKITFTQNTSTTVNNGTIEYTITVDSVANTLAVSGTSFTKYVDQEVTSVRSNQNSDGEISTTSSNHNLAHYDIANNKIVIPNSDAQNLPFDNVIITISQAATAKYKAKKHTITLTVNKYANSLSCSWEGWSKNVNFDSHTAVTFTSTNTETGAPAVTISKVSGGAVADYNSSTKKIDANHRDGTVIWEIEQVENYKYVRAYEKCTVNVGTVSAPDCDVLLYSSDPDNEASEVGEIDLGGVGTRVDFQMKKKGAGATATLSFYVPGSGWSSRNVSASSIINYDNHSEDLPTGTTKIKFAKGGTFGTDDPYINTIRVMRTKYFDIENKAGSAITEMTMPLNIHGGVVKRDTFYVDYSTCEGTIKLENHHPRIKFAATNSNSYSFSTGTAHYGRPAIALTYTSPANDAENITDTIYIYTPSDHKKLIIHAQSKGKLQTTLHYIGNASYTTDATNIAATALFEVRDENNDLVANPIITLGTGTTSNVTLANDNKSIASLCGNSNDGTTGNVTASYAGDGTYEAATNNGLSQNFTINRLDDEVSFDSGYESMVVGEEIDLTEWATSCTSGSDITVTSVFKDYIVIEDGKVKAVAKGDGRLRAESAGNCTYNSGRKFLNITVRNPQDPCESAILYKSALIKVGAYTHNSSNPETYTIPDGPQDKLTFKVWKVTAATQEATLQILDKNDNVLTNGTIDYGAGSLSGSEPDEPNVTIDMANYPGAKKLHFYGGGTLNKYFSEVRISQKAYLTAGTSSVTMSTVQACDTAKGQFTVDFSDLSRIHLEQTNNDFTYEVWDGETKLDGFNNDCGDYGTYTVKFFYVPQAKGDYKDTVTLNASGKSQTIILSGTANKPNRTIVWDIPSGNTISATQSLDLTAYARTSCQSPAGSVYYTASPAGAVTIEENHITFNEAATVTVTAHSVTSDDYNDATTVDKVWTVGKVGTQMSTLPTITSTITYGDNSSVVAWKNDWVAVSSLNNEDTIRGSIAYVGPASFNAAGPQNLTFNFAPTDVYAYDVCQFTVPVTVQKATTTASANAIVLTYGETPDSKTLTTASAALDGTWSWNDDRSDDILNASADAYALNVTFTPDNTNYAPYETTVNVTVNKIETLEVEVPLSFCAGGSATFHGNTYTEAGTDQIEAVGATRDTVYNVTVTELLPTTGTDSKTITVGDEESWNGIDLSGYAVGEHSVEAVLTNAVGCDSTVTLTLTVNGVPANEFIGNGDWDDPTNWSSGEVPEDEAPNVVVSGELVIEGKVTVGDLTIQPEGGVTIVDNGKLTVTGESDTIPEYGDIHVMDDGALELENTAHLEVRHFTLDAKLGTVKDDSKKGASGQVSGDEQLNINGAAYFDLQLDPGARATYGWYTFTIPFEVNVVGGIYRLNDDGSMTLYKAGKDFIVMRYDEAKRARGEKGWVKLNSGVLHAGIAYNITVDDEVEQNVLRFVWNKNNALGASYSCPLQLSESTTDKAGWNGLGNGTLTHTQLNGLDEEAKVQMYDHESNTFVGVYAKNFTYAVGTAFFYQAQNTDPLVLTEADGSRVLRAPQREMQHISEFQLSLREEDSDSKSDLLYISADEQATGDYTVGRDLLKMSNPTEAKIVQMWTENNGLKLCDIEMPLVNEKANCALGLYAPKFGSYWLAIDKAPEDAALYLTYNDVVIWDLTTSPYFLDLDKGTTNGYGLRIEAKKAPAVTTDVEQTDFSGQSSVRKVIIDNKIYIVTPEGKMYDIIGKGIKF